MSANNDTLTTDEIVADWNRRSADPPSSIDQCRPYIDVLNDSERQAVVDIFEATRNVSQTMNLASQIVSSGWGGWTNRVWKSRMDDPNWQPLRDGANWRS